MPVFSGTSSNDSITGTNNNDTLNGGLGKDTLTGGNGNDLYIIDNKSDKIIEGLDAGIDAVQSTISYVLGKNLENLKLLGAANINATGNELNNILEGNDGNNKLSGLVGNDTLIGGLGVDKLTGGKSADIFTFTSINDSGTTSKTRDTITDFKHSEGDKIDLSGVDFSKFIGTQAFSTTDATGQLRFDAKTHILYGSTNADNQPEFSILLSGIKSLTDDDFIFGDKPEAPSVSLTTSATNIKEGSSVTYTATLTAASPTSDLNIPYTLSGTGITTSDFIGLTALTGNINVPAGATTGSLMLNVVNDLTTEGEETFFITLGAIAGVNLGMLTTVSTVIADTSVPVIITGVTSLVAGGVVAASTAADVFKLVAATSSYTTTVTNGFNYLVDKIEVPKGATLPSAVAGGMNDLTDGNVDLTWANNSNVVTISLTGLNATSEAAIQLNAVSDTIFGTY